MMNLKHNVISIKHPQINAKLIKSNGKSIPWFAYDMLGQLEFYSSNPFIDFNANLAAVGNKKEINIFYNTNKPNVRNFKIILLNDAYFENEITTIYKSGLILTNLKPRRI